jgi:hypothetical protein
MRLAIALAVLAASPAAGTEVVRLSDAQRDAVIAAAARGPEKEPVLTPEQAKRQSVLDRSLYPEFYGQSAGAPGARDRKVHGEMSVFAGSGGTVGYSGTAILPVGQTGSAAISVTQGTSRWGGFQNFGFGYSSGGNNALGFSGSFGNPYGPYGYGYPYASPFGFGGPPRYRQPW